MSSGERIQKTWAELKALAISKHLAFNYEQYPNLSYIVYLMDSNVLWISHLTDSGDITDFETTYKDDANLQTPTSIQITDGVNPPAQITASGGLWRLATDSIVTVEEIFGKDNNADTWFFITEPAHTNDTVTITINNATGDYGDPPYYQKVITFPSDMNTFGDETAEYIVATLNLDTTFHDEWWKAKRLNNIVFIISQKVAERGEVRGLSPAAFTVAVTGNVEVSVPAECNEIVSRRKSTLLTPDPRDNRLGILGVRGEVSTLQRAENPIFANIKSYQAATTFTRVFYRSTEEFWVDYLLQFAMGSQLGSEFEVYHGLHFNEIETFTGISTNRVTLQHVAINYEAGYISVTVNGSPFTAYTIQDEPGLESYQSRIVRNTGNFLPTDTIVVTYNAMARICNLWCPKEDSIIYPLQAPLKVDYGQWVIAYYLNHSANAGSITFNTNGYRIDANEVFI